MANVRAFRSGNWSDTNPATSPWGTGGVLYAPAANDDVYSNNFTIHVDQNVTVNSVTNASATSRLWKDGATTTATAGGTFNLLNDVVVTTSSIGNNIIGGSANVGCVTLSGTNSATIYGNVIGGTGVNFWAIDNTSTGTTSILPVLTVIGNFGTGVTTTSYSLYNRGTYNIVNIIGNITTTTTNTPSIVSSGGTINITGNLTISGAGTNGLVTISENSSLFITGNVSCIGGTGAQCVRNNGVGTAQIVGNIFGSPTGGTVGLSTTTTGTNIIIGNLFAGSQAAAFTSSNASAINKISGNIINNSNGTAAIYATRYVIDPVPTNSVIQYSNTNMFTTDSLSAFSMPPVSAVRSGVSFANSTLTGTCRVPSANSVNVGVPVDNTVGTAFLTPATLFDASVASLTASDSLGARLKNSATVQSVGNIVASFSN